MNWKIILPVAIALFAIAFFSGMVIQQRITKQCVCDCDCPEIPPAANIDFSKIKRGATVHVHQDAKVTLPGGDLLADKLVGKIDSLLTVRKISRCK